MISARAVPVAMGSTEQVIGDRGGRPTPAGRFCSWKVRGDHVGLSSELLKVRARTSTVGTVCNNIFAHLSGYPATLGGLERWACDGCAFFLCCSDVYIHF